MLIDKLICIVNYVNYTTCFIKMNLKLGIFAIFYLLKFLCLIPFSLNFNSLEIKFSIKSIIWCITFSAALITLDPYMENIAYGIGQSLSHKLEMYLSRGSYIVILISVYWSIFNIKIIFKLIYLLGFIFAKLNKFDDRFHKTDLFLKNYLIKFLTIQFTLLLIFIVYYFYICNGTVLGIFLYVPIINLKHLFASSMLIKYDLFLILLRIGFSKVNTIIKRNKISKISDCIDELAKIHFKLCEACYLVSKTFSVPILTFLGYIFLVIETQFFKVFHCVITETDEGVLGILCMLFWGTLRVYEFVIVLQDGNMVVKKVNLRLV